jgi:hypothetical protein
MRAPPLELALDHGAGWLWQGPTAGQKRRVATKKAEAKKRGKAAKESDFATLFIRTLWTATVDVVVDNELAELLSHLDPRIDASSLSTTPDNIKHAYLTKLTNKATITFLVHAVSRLCDRLATMSSECTDREACTNDTTAVIQFVLKLMRIINNQTVGAVNDTTVYHRDFDPAFKAFNDGANVFDRMLSTVIRSDDINLNRMFSDIANNLHNSSTEHVANLMASAAARVGILVCMPNTNFEANTSNSADISVDSWIRMKQEKFHAVASVVATLLWIAPDKATFTSYIAQFHKSVKKKAAIEFRDRARGNRTEKKSWRATEDMCDVQAVVDAATTMFIASIPKKGL